MSEIRTECTNWRCRGKPPSLSINKEKGVYYCFRCGEKGRTGNPSRQARLYGFEMSPKELEPVPESTLIVPGMRSYEYLEKRRGISPDVLMSVPIRESDKGIVFLFPEEAYWQERRWSEYRPPAWKNASPAPRTTSNGVIYNVRSYPISDRVVVVEGIIDALAVAEFENAAAVLTNQVQDMQAQHLAQLYTKAVYMPDGDVPLKKIIKSKTILQEAFNTVVTYVSLPKGEDPASLRKEEMMKIMMGEVLFT